MKMQKINIATGFVKPKTTSLFFDKIWLPEDDLIDYQEDIPSNILFKIETTKHKKRIKVVCSIIIYHQIV